MRHNTYRLLLGLICLLGTVSMAVPQNLQPTSLTDYRTIVLATESSSEVRRAAQDLRYHLRKITGREFPIVTRDKMATGGLCFFIGPGSLPRYDETIAALPTQGWLIKSVPEGLLLGGNDVSNIPNGRATYHAVPEFLEKYCHVRWLWPGESGEVIPRNPTLMIPVIDQSDTPKLKRRWEFIGYFRFWNAQLRQVEYRTWEARQRMGNQLNANFGHAWESVIPHGMYFEKHPEWFALVKGKRDIRQLCISNRELRDEFTKRLLELPGNRKLNIVSVSANDGLGFCECDLCKAKGTTGDAYWDFVNDIAGRVEKLRPDLGIGTFAYSVGHEPPKKIEKLPDNVWLSMATYSAKLQNPEEEKNYQDFVDAWKPKVRQWVMRESSLSHYSLGMPISHPEEVARAMEYAYHSGMVGFYVETGKFYATNAPHCYMITRKMWEPEATPEAILDEFYNDGFGVAGPQIRSYFELYYNAIRQAWIENNADSSMHGHLILMPYFREIYSPELLQKAGQYLDQADALAKSDPELQKRLAFIRSGYNYTALMAELIGLYAHLQKAGVPLGSFPRKDLAMPTAEEKQAMLTRAWELGQQRIEMHNANVMNFAFDEGILAWANTANLRQWHKAVGKALGKPESEIVPLIHGYHPAKPATPSVLPPVD